MKLMLLRYHSRYSKFVKQLLEKYNIDDYVFTSDVSFLDIDNGANKVLKSKAWPEAQEIIIKAVSDEISDVVFKQIVEFKKENGITNKLKIMIVPLLKNG